MGDCSVAVQSLDIFVTEASKNVLNENDSDNSSNKTHRKVTFVETLSKHNNTPKIWPQYLAAFAAQISGFYLGVSWFWSATGVPSMVDSGDLGDLSKSEKAWITSSPMLGALLVCPITGYCLNTFGRQKTLLWASVPAAAAWFLISSTTNLPLILIGRIIVGGCCGLNGQIGPILISESVQAHIRGSLMTMYELVICFGTLFIYIVGTYTSWQIQAITCGIVPIIGFIALYFTPESPYYLMEINCNDEAIVSLCWLRGVSSKEDITEEIIEVRKTVQEKMTNQGDLGWREALKDPAVWKPILLSMALMMFFQGSYLNVILNTTVEIFQSAGSYNEYSSTIIIGVIQVIATFVPILIADKCGRRILILISLFMITASLICFGLFFHLKHLYGESFTKDYGWVPLASLIAYITACSIGIVPLSWVMTAEIAPPKAKGLASGLVGIWNRLVGLVVIFTFWDLIEVLGQAGTFWFIAAINFAAGLIMIFYLPETKGKTLDEIQLYFARSSGDKMTKM